MKDYVLIHEAIRWSDGNSINKLKFSDFPDSKIEKYKDVYIEITSNGHTQYLIFDNEIERNSEHNAMFLHLNSIKPLSIPGGKMFSEVTTDMKSFIKTNKSTIYWLACLILADQLFFQGAYREKLKEMMNKLVGRAEEEVNRGLSMTPAPHTKA